MTTTNNTQKSFFDLHISGVGYLNRVRHVTPKRGDAFWACDIAALNGPSDDVSYTRFDCKVSGREAESLVKRCQQAIDMNRKVLISFKLGDLWTDTFTYSKGDKAGQAGVSLKARLLFIQWIKIDGKMVHQAPRRDDQQQSQEAAAPAQPQAEQPMQQPEQPAPVAQVAFGQAPQPAPQAQQSVPPQQLAQGYAAGSFDSPAAMQQH